GESEDRAAVDLERGRQARHDHGRRLQQAGVLELHWPRHADRGRRVEEDRGRGRRLRVRRLKVVPNRFQRARDGLGLEMEMGAVAYLNGRRMVSIPLARTGDSERRQMLSEYSLVARNEKSSGGVFDNTTS